LKKKRILIIQKDKKIIEIKRMRIKNEKQNNIFLFD
jgi:hypothetical protein